jgi:hypothetical protein
VVTIGVPSGARQAFEICGQGIEGRVSKLAAEPTTKFFFRQMGIRPACARLGAIGLSLSLIPRPLAPILSQAFYDFLLLSVFPLLPLLSVPAFRLCIALFTFLATDRDSLAMLFSLMSSVCWPHHPAVGVATVSALHPSATLNHRRFLCPRRTSTRSSTTR